MFFIYSILDPRGKDGLADMRMLKTRVKLRGNNLYPHKSMCYVTLICVVDSGMRYSEFLDVLGKAGVSVRAFAELVGMNPNSISNYARTGELPTHLALIAVLLVGVLELGGDYRQIIAKVKVTLKKPRGGARQGHFGGDRQTNLDLDA